MGDEGWQFGPDADRRQRERQEAPARNLSRWPIRATPAASPCRCCGTRSSAPSSTTSRPKSSACSIRRSMRSPTIAPTTIRPRCAARSTRSTSSCSRTSTTASIAAASPRTQEAYEEAFLDLFGTLDQLEERLSRQRYLCGDADHRGRLAAVHHAGALRCGLCRPLQVQPAPHRGLSEPVELSARSLPGAGRRRDGEHRSHQAALLHEHAAASIRAASCRSARRWISRRRMTGGGSDSRSP